MLQFPQQNRKRTNLDKMKCAELCLQRQYKTHGGVKWLCEHRTPSRFIKLRIPSQNINTNYH